MGDSKPPVATGGGHVDNSPQNVTNNVGISTTTSQEQPPISDHGEPATGLQNSAMSQNAFAAQLDMTGPANGSRQGGPYNMASMANSLPQAPYRGAQYPTGPQQRYNSAASPPMVPQMPQQMSHYGPSPSMSMANQAYYGQQPPQMAQYYPAAQMSSAQSQSQLPPRQNMGYYPNQMMMGHPQGGFYYPQATQYAAPAQGASPAMMSGQYMPASPTTNSDPRALGQTPEVARFPPPHDMDRRQSAVRGPPRKPRQSGHAIWIGNLPPQTDLMTLVHHVCKEALGLESLFLISKSNCAFANFKDESSCVEAQQKLHDSKFQSVRLVSRLRKNTVEGAGGATAPTGPAATTNTPGPTSNDETSSVSHSDIESPSPVTSHPPSKGPNATVEGVQPDKFFILKSLTVEDLELSVRTGIWATQSHNEETLSTAYKSADNVYLVFSANKSGEYFGYARMLSEINEDPDAAIEFAPKAPSAADIDLPKAISTDATEHAPKGRIIDDSARGTIFWEVDREESENGSDEESEVASSKDVEIEEDGQKSWGKPFKLEWLSTNRLPFYRARGLRNPWNSNREVKIARDGTELEPAVGRRLIGLFNRLQNTPPYGAPLRPPMGVMAGFTQMRPYGP